MRIMKTKVGKGRAGLAAWLFFVSIGAAALGVLGACVDSGGQRTNSAGAATSSGASTAKATAAPEFPAGLPWLNTAEPLTMKELRGKIVLIDFWTYGCINCIHDIPWLKKIQADYSKYLVVIGVHSAKFSEEGNTRNIREIILRYGITWPVVNDYQFKIWNVWGVDVWPTLALVDPMGNVVGFHIGEGFYPIFKPIIASLVRGFGGKGLLDPRPIALKLESQGLPESVLAFPGKVRVDAKGNRLFIADTGHNRIVVAALDSGQVLEVIGSGAQGFANRDFRQAEFNQPEGMALSPDGATLYVADTGNHAIRKVDLSARRVTTLAGTGVEATGYPPAGGTAPVVALNSPWDLALSGETLYIAMAGSHQIWEMDLHTNAIHAYAGSGMEGNGDGSRKDASFAQPSGITIGEHGDIYVANSEGSSIREIEPRTGMVSTVAGAGSSLFHFGYQDGNGESALFQHPLGIVAYRGLLYVADTYNNRIRMINPRTEEVTTLAGGKAGWRDGKDPRFYEPGGLDAANGRLYVADTDNNAIRVVNLATGETTTLVLQGISLLSKGDVYANKAVTLPAVRVAAGRGEVRLFVRFPEGYAPNAQAPSEVEVRSTGGPAVSLPTGTRYNAADPRFPMSFPATFTAGTGEITVDLSLVYCQEQEASVCLIKQVRLVIPVDVGPSMPSGREKPVLSVDYRVRLAS